MLLISGQKYAMYSIKTTLTTFLINYSVHTCVKLTDIKLKVDTLLRSVDGFPVTIRPRNIKQWCELDLITIM